MSRDYSKSSRISTLYCIVTTLLTTLVLIGLVIIALSEYWRHVISAYLGGFEKDEISLQFHLIQFFGMNLTITYVCGFALNKKCAYDPYTSHLATLLKVWHIFVLFVIIHGFLVAMIVWNSSSTIEKSAELSFLQGIEIYYTNPEWRIIFDDMQYHEECCGVNSYLDWDLCNTYEYVNVDQTDSQLNEDEGAEQLQSYVPYSCCKHNVSCMPMPIPRRISDNIMELEPLTKDMINTNGCFPMFINKYEAGLQMNLIAALLALFLQICLLITMRLLFIMSRDYTPLNGNSHECISNCSCTKQNAGEGRICLIQLEAEQQEKDDGAVSLHKCICVNTEEEIRHSEKHAPILIH